MACRCADITKYEHDIPILERASTWAQKVIDCQTVIDDSIDALDADYNASIIPPKDLSSSFVKIHEGADLNARLAKTQIDGALQTARLLLSAARQEDDAYDHEGEG